MKEKANILLSLDGPYENVLKFKPPIVFNRENAEFLLSNLADVLVEIEALIVNENGCLELLTNEIIIQDCNNNTN